MKTHATLLASVLALAPCPASAGTVAWNVTGDGDWGKTTADRNDGANVFADGDDVVFPLVYDITRDRLNLITVVAAGMAPASMAVTGSGYGATFEFGGGDITDSTSPNTLTLNWDNGTTAFTRAMSFSTIQIDNQRGLGFYFDSPGAVAQTIYINEAIELGSNDQVDWSKTTVYINADVTLADNDLRFGKTFDAIPGDVFPGLELILTGNHTLHVDGDPYRENSQVFFSGKVITDGTTDAILTLAGANAHATNRSKITGPGNWTIHGVEKTDTSIIDIEAPEIFGNVLKVSGGKLNLVNAFDKQTVNELWLGGVQMTDAGTYGAAGSGADHINQRHLL